jgi:RHS repeat-associated protein
MATILGGAVSPPQATEVMYDERDNITYKSDVGRYWYDPDRPNRMVNVTLETAPGAQLPYTGTRALSYAFDDLNPGAKTVNGISSGNGNLQYTVSQDTVNSVHTVRGESYTSFNMPSQIVYGNFVSPTTSTADRTITFVYGPEHQRIKQTVQLSGTGTSSYQAGTTWMANGIDSLGLSYEKAILANGVTENKHYVSTRDGLVFALHVSRSGSLGTLTTTTTSYLHQDYLGSVAVVTDKSGVVAERMAYDPWGKRRNINGNADPLDQIVGNKTDRGYTMQEHIDEIGVIHMNARVYDPLVGRFMSADSIIPNPTDMKSFNRYSYTTNNPLRYADPTGHEEVEYGQRGSGDGTGAGSCITCEWRVVYVDPGAPGTQDPNTGYSRAGGTGGPTPLPPRSVDSQQANEQLGLTAQSASSSDTPTGATPNGVAQQGDISGAPGPVATSGALSQPAVSGVQVAVLPAVIGAQMGAGLLNPAGAYAGALAPQPDGSAVAVNRDVVTAVERAWTQLLNLINKVDENGQQEVQYALVAERTTLYPTVRGETILLEKGDVWKYGTTIDPAGRYSQSALATLGLRMEVQATGTNSQVLVAEKLQLIQYFLSNADLPPGNKIFK